MRNIPHTVGMSLVGTGYKNTADVEQSSPGRTLATVKRPSQAVSMLICEFLEYHIINDIVHLAFGSGLV